MPAVSKAQYRLMQLVKHNQNAQSRLKIPPEVADEMTKSYDKKMPERIGATRARTLRARQA